jgi:hypothetical protein
MESYQTVVSSLWEYFPADTLSFRLLNNMSEVAEETPSYS